MDTIIPKYALGELSIKTFVLQDSVVNQVVEDPWLSRRKSILPTIAESLDDRCSVESDHDQPFEVNLDNCLLTLIIRSGNPKPETALLYAAQLLASISSLHAAGVVHGLISPETVAVRDEKYLVLCDCERRTRLPNLLSPRDHDHQRMYLYAAPEIILGWTHGPAVDSWGFGLVLYYMLIGFHPFGDRDGQEDRIVNAKSHTLKYLHLLDEDARDLVSKCLERNPAVRPSVSDIKVHPYFSEIDWSKMVTRYVRCVRGSEHKAERHVLWQTSTLFSPAENLSKSIAQMELAISNLDLTLEMPNSEKSFSNFPFQPSETLERPSQLSSTVRRSEWFSSTVNVLEGACNPTAGPTTESELEEQNTLHQQAVHPADDDKDQRMKLFWDLLDAEQNAQATSVPAEELPNTLTYFTSRPRRKCKRQSFANFSPNLPLWRSSLEVSSARLNNKPDQNTIKPQVQTILGYDDFNFPPGIERIGYGIGYTCSLPAANRSKLSICSSAPRSCYGMFGHSSKFSGLGIGFGQLTSRRPKATFIKKSRRTEGRSPFSGNTTTVIYGSTRPALTNATSASPLRQDSDDGNDTDDNGPWTPDTIGFIEDSRHDMEKYYQGLVTETPTLRLVSASPSAV